MNIMDIFLLIVGSVTLFFSGASYALVRGSGDWKDYSMVAIQVFLGLLIIVGVLTRAL